MVGCDGGGIYYRWTAGVAFTTKEILYSQNNRLRKSEFIEAVRGNNKFVRIHINKIYHYIFEDMIIIVIYCIY